MRNIDRNFLRLAVSWFVVGVCLGIGMGMSQKFTLMPVHVHINLLGWVSMTLFAVFYHLWPQAAASSLAKWHFWLYVPAHLVMMISLALEVTGNPGAGPVLGIASIVVGLGVLCFAVLAWKTVGEPSPSAAMRPVGSA